MFSEFEFIDSLEFIDQFLDWQSLTKTGENRVLVGFLNAILTTTPEVSEILSALI